MINIVTFDVSVSKGAEYLIIYSINNESQLYWHEEEILDFDIIKSIPNNEFYNFEWIIKNIKEHKKFDLTMKEYPILAIDDDMIVEIRKFMRKSKVNGIIKSLKNS